MKKHPIHQNLNTSFVNVAALVRYLSGLQFVGNIRIELSSYEAEIIFTSAHEIRGREYDHIAGRVSEGHQALQRILVRANTPCGRIHVYEALPGDPSADAFLDETIAERARSHASIETDRPKPIAAPAETAPRATSVEEWVALLDLTALILKTVDGALAKGGLSFPVAFRNACISLAEKYPFFANGFTFKHGSVVTREQIDPDVFVEAIGEALLCVFERLRTQPRLVEWHRLALHRVLVISDRKRRLFDRFAMTAQVDRLRVGS